MKYFFISLFICLLGYPSLVKAGEIISDNVKSFASNDRDIVYVKEINNSYYLYLNDNLIIESIYPISYPNIDVKGNIITFSGSNILNENRYCTSILDGENRICNDIYLYDTNTRKIKSISSRFDGNSYISDLSGNGRYVIFESSASNITSDYIYTCKSYSNNIDRYCTNIYKYDLHTSTYSLVSKNVISARYDSMEPSVNYDGSIIVFRSMDSFFDNNKYCYNEYYDTFSYCSIIYMSYDGVLKMISDNKFDSYNAFVSSNSNYVSFDSYSTMSLFDYHYQNSTFLYDIDNDKYRVINKSPNRVISNVMIDGLGKYNLSISKASNIVDSNVYLDNLFITNISTGKSIVIDDVYNYDISDGYISSDSKYVYYLGNNRLVKCSLTSSGPVISSTRSLVILRGKSYDLFKYIHVEDDLDINVSTYVIDYRNFNVNIPGSYTILIGAIDSHNNVSIYEYSVEVIDKDLSGPIFIGDSKYVIDINDKNFRLSDYINVIDNIDDNVRYSVVSGNVDISKVGKYKLVLKASDSSSNESYFNVVIEVKDNSSSVMKSVGAFFVVGFIIWYVVLLKKK